MIEHQSNILPSDEQPKSKKKVRRKRSIAHRLFIWFNVLLFYVFALSVILLVVIQLPPVQQYTINKVTSFLSEEWKTQVTIGRFSLSYVDDIVLEDVYIEDQQHDTLLYANNLKVSIHPNLFEISNGNILINSISLSDAIFHLRHRKGQADNNLQFIIDYFSPKKKSSQPKQTIQLGLKSVHLQDVTYINEDAKSGTNMTAKVKNGTLAFRKFDLKNKKIDLSSIKIQQPFFDLQKYNRDTMQAKKVVVNNNTVQTKDTSTTWDIRVKKLMVSEGYFAFDNFRNERIRTSPTDKIDYRHLKIHDIEIDIDTLKLQHGAFTGQVNQLSADTKIGFNLKKLSANHVFVSDTITKLYGLDLESEKSHVGDTMIFEYNHYADFEDFNNNVRMTAIINKAEVALKDIMFFGNGLYGIDFFSHNINTQIVMDGNVSGTVNKLRGNDLNISFDNNTGMQGSFRSYNLGVKREELIDIEFDKLQANSASLRQLIPNLKLPENFNSLGNLIYSGRFSGFFDNFVTNGKLNTDLGDADLDMQLNLQHGKQAATYSGSISLYDFDLKKLTGDPNLGTLKMSAFVKKGSGLTAETAQAELNAKIDALTYKNYTYQHITLDGNLSKRLFNGNLKITDENVDLDFGGKIDYTADVPQFDFASNVKKINLKTLNFANQDLVMSANVDLKLRDISLNNMQGKATIQNLKILNGSKQHYTLDTVQLTSVINSPTDKVFNLKSAIGTATLAGQFNLAEVHKVFANYFAEHYPVLNQKIGLPHYDNINQEQHFSLSANITNSLNFTTLIDENLDTIKNLSVQGFVDNNSDTLQIGITTPYLKYKNIVLTDVFVNNTFKTSTGKDTFEVRKLQIGENAFGAIYLKGNLLHDTVQFNINVTNLSSLMDNANFEGELFIVDSSYQINFSQSNFKLFEDTWQIAEENYIRFGNKTFSTQNFILTNGDKRIALESVNDKGLLAKLDNLNISFINQIWAYKDLQFNGLVSAEAQVDDIMQLNGITAHATVDSLYINGDNFGKLSTTILMPTVKSQANIFLTIDNSTQRLAMRGFYIPPEADSAVSKRNTFLVDVGLQQYPARILKYFVHSGVSDIIGTFDANLKFSGKPELINVSGGGKVQNTSFTIDYLNTRYFIKNESFKVTNSLVDATNATIFDALGNTAKITGGITHNHLKNFGLNVRIVSPTFLCLNTTKEHNQPYYGYGIGAGDIYFSGDFARTNIDIEATTSKGSRLFIPIVSNQDTSAINFIKFKPKYTEASPKKNTSVQFKEKGLQVSMYLNVTDDAEVQLIFDERAGDIIKGRGNGNLQINIPRNGNLNMYGQYDIMEGEYLFTLMNVINKPFKVERGGNIRWNGNPFEAIIDLNASYRGLSTSMSNFLIEYLSTDELRAEAKKSTPVDLQMHLTGELMQPNISFDISFPRLVGEVKNLAESKLRILKQDPNELNRQVFGLIVIGGFLPSSGSGFNNFGSVAGINTVTEFLSNQLSLYVTNILSDVFTEKGFIRNVNFDINYNVYDNTELTPTGTSIQTGNELQLGIKNNIINDRVTLILSGSINLNGTQNANSGSLTTGNFEIEIDLTEDRRIKLKPYYLYTQEALGNRNKGGVSLIYRREYESFNELSARIKSGLKSFFFGG
ncbi:MAG: translocation/assembly module TamB domain-containing protein [Saprospiraceae bacterium]|nr:translocation/assembly module TamB domain-containing protein [Saprospiraceae bacterium]MBP7699619.1 translocation/assembly module TamB domain-containing protein [Saprospiraceae bacterium]